VIPASAALLPVILFLAALFLMDSFKLVPVRSVAAALAGGAVSALAVLWLHQEVLPIDGASPQFVSRYVAPVTEEAAKGLLVVLLIAAGRVGFLVDAAVLGFAIGAGFAVVENVVYLSTLSNAPFALWLVRGLGTAMLHGATTAIVAMITRERMDRRNSLPLAFLPGFALAVIIHSASNHLLLQPVAQALIIMMMLPAIVVWIFDRSERATREWVSAGLDLDLQVLQLVVSNEFGVTRFGEYLQQLRARFPGAVVADMYCLLRLELELAVQAKALVMARGAGLELPADDDLDAALAEREYLQRSIGRTGLLALRPLQITSYRDQWHRRLLRR
jgi:RsiW-degrading membrane proteinase PrsW (M82 family)